MPLFRKPFSSLAGDMAKMADVDEWVGAPCALAVPATRTWPLLCLFLSVRDHGLLYPEGVNDVPPSGHINGHYGLVSHGRLGTGWFCRVVFSDRFYCLCEP